MLLKLTEVGGISFRPEESFSLSIVHIGPCLVALVCIQPFIDYHIRACLIFWFLYFDLFQVKVQLVSKWMMDCIVICFMAGRHVERSVTALFCSRSVLITDIQLFHDFAVFLDAKSCGLVYSFKNVFEKNVAGSWVHRYTEGCESRSYHSLVSLLADSCLNVDAGGSLLIALSAVNVE